MYSILRISLDILGMLRAVTGLTLWHLSQHPKFFKMKSKTWLIIKLFQLNMEVIKSISLSGRNVHCQIALGLLMRRFGASTLTFMKSSMLLTRRGRVLSSRAELMENGSSQLKSIKGVDPTVLRPKP
ncbi:hypothetical protein CsSME_00051441 [Camellia sinensis var. sinensis]